MTSILCPRPDDEPAPCILSTTVTPCAGKLLVCESCAACSQCVETWKDPPSKIETTEKE